ncbi:MAG: hypothetical protein LBH44_02870 [Treponema sp.]|jgi:hypothetical protein|nr:hypothetical protein [Treponema sp.]
MKPVYIAAALLLIFCADFLPAQSAAEEIETLLSTEAVTYAAAARFLLEAADVIVTPDPQEAFRYAMWQKWLPKNTAADGTARLDGISKLLMHSFDMKGGVMYSITKNHRYAYRELVHKKIIQGRCGPAMNVSGERLLAITGRMLSEKEKETD